MRQRFEVRSSDQANPLEVHFTYAEALEGFTWRGNDAYGRGHSVTLDLVEICEGVEGPGGEQVYGLMRLTVLPR
jgi:hypothetical protein